MKRFAVLVVAAALVVGAMAAMSVSIDAQAAAQAGRQTQPASPAASHTMSMMNQSPTDQPAMGQMMGQGQMMGSNAKTGELLEAVKTATGDAKIDALADLIVGLFGQSRHMMSSGSVGMTGGMLNMNGGMHGATNGMMGGARRSGSGCAQTQAQTTQQQKK